MSATDRKKSDPLAGHPRFKKIKDVNSGSFGSVVQALDRKENMVVAIKLLHRGGKITEYVDRELQAHRLLWHPHIIKLYSVFLTDTHLGIAMEYADAGDMYDYVSTRGRLRESQARWIFQQMMIAIDYLHRLEVANRDIKLENTLLAGSLDKPLVKLCDFGFAKSLQMHSIPNSRVGTPTYFAPEVIDQRTYDGRVADIWSLGVMLYTMLYGVYPFERPEDHTLKAAAAQAALLQRIRAVDYTFRESVRVSDEARDLISRMLVKDPAARITVPGIMAHPFFATGLPEGVSSMNEKLLANTHIPQRQGAEEIRAIVEEAKKVPHSETDAHLDALMDQDDLYGI